MFHINLLMVLHVRASVKMAGSPLPCRGVLVISHIAARVSILCSPIALSPIVVPRSSHLSQMGAVKGSGM